MTSRRVQIYTDNCRTLSIEGYVDAHVTNGNMYYYCRIHRPSRHSIGTSRHRPKLGGAWRYDPWWYGAREVPARAGAGGV